MCPWKSSSAPSLYVEVGVDNNGKSNRHNFPCKNHCLYHVQKHRPQNLVLICWKPKRFGLATLQTVYEKEGHNTRMDILTIFDNLSHWLFCRNVKKLAQNWLKLSLNWHFPLCHQTTNWCNDGSVGFLLFLLKCIILLLFSTFFSGYCCFCLFCCCYMRILKRADQDKKSSVFV